MSKKITDIFFDLDHTLWDFDKNSEITFDFILKKNNINIQTKQFVAHYQPINLKYWKLYRDEKVSKKDLRYKRLKETFNAVNLKVRDDVIHTLSEEYILYLTNSNHLFEDTIEILEYLKPKYKLHIITNGFEEVQTTKLKKSKIDSYFESVTNSEMVGVKKPNRKIFDFALNLANTTVEQSIMIGDNFEADIMGALNIGLDAICFNYHNETLTPEIKQIKKLIELKKHL
ncbi:YjjG family noncanonical pyrimidine nucleotidase [Lacinutrix salivirga]